MMQAVVPTREQRNQAVSTLIIAGDAIGHDMYWVSHDLAEQVGVMALARCNRCAQPLDDSNPLDYTTRQGWAFMTLSGMIGGDATVRSCNARTQRESDEETEEEEDEDKDYDVTLVATLIRTQHIRVSRTICVSARSEEEAEDIAYAMDDLDDPAQWYEEEVFETYEEIEGIDIDETRCVG